MIAAAFLLAVAAPAATPAQDVADVSTRVCYALAAGTLTLPTGTDPVAAREAQDKVVTAQGLAPGLDKVAFDGLGELGTAMVSQAIMGSRVNGTARIVLALGGRFQGCRTMLVSDVSATETADIEAALTAAGWRRVPGLGGMQGPVERRVFLRRDTAKKPYLLNLMLLPAGAPASGRLRLFTSVAAVPPTVQIPEGF